MKMQRLEVIAKETGKMVHFENVNCSNEYWFKTSQYLELKEFYPANKYTIKEANQDKNNRTNTVEFGYNITGRGEGDTL